MLRLEIMYLGVNYKKMKKNFFVILKVSKERSWIN
jgi:hypothetical protein